MQTLLTFIAAVLCILPILFKMLVGNIDFIDPTAHKVYISFSIVFFFTITTYDVVTFIRKKAPQSIRYLALLSVFALIGFVPDFNSIYYGFFGFLGFLAFMTYQNQ